MPQTNERAVTNARPYKSSTPLIDRGIVDRMPKRPTKKWMDACLAGVSKSGSAYDPGAVCGATWYRKPLAERAAIARADERTSGKRAARRSSRRSSRRSRRSSRRSRRSRR